MLSRDYKDPTAVNSGYTVRRLTPTGVRPAARLPGLVVCRPGNPRADRGRHLILDGGLGDTPQSRESLREAQDGRQIVKWLKTPYSDAAEYKMWGNGVALPCVWFVLSGIVFSTQLSPT